jgi:hypothetical protein
MMDRRHSLITVLTMMLCAFATFPAFAQVNATVGGTVADGTGALIPGVEVTARNVNTGIVTNRITNETGAYEFPSLQPGNYTLSAELSGFQTATFNNVQLSQGQQVRLNFTLQVSAVAQAVEVVVDADTSLATTTSSVGDVLPDVEVRSLPLSNRNVLDLVSTTAGVVDDYFGGARMSQINTTRDGLPTSDGRYLDWNGAYSATFTSPDLVEEVQVAVNSIDAAVGRGSAQVRMQTRSGTNEFHGALFYGNYNSALSSQGFFENLRGAQKSYRNRNQFGGRLGGPIIRNKAFFFVLYDGQRFLEKVNQTSVVLTEPARQGIFRYLTAGSPRGTSRRNGNAFATTPSVDLNGNILTSAGGQPLFVNTINVFQDINDPNRRSIDSTWVSSQMLPRMPLPNDYSMGDGLNTAGFRWLRRHSGLDSATGTDPNPNRNQLSMRFDYQLNGNNKLSYTMTREKNWGVTGQTGLPAYPNGYFGEVQRRPDFYSLSWTSTLSPTVLNEFRWGMKRDSFIGWSPFHVGCCYDGAGDNEISELSKEVTATFPKVSTGHLLFIAQQGAGGLGLGAYAPFGVASPRYSKSPLSQFANTLSWTKSAHAFQGGFEATFANSDQSNTGGDSTSLPFATLGVGNIPVPGVTTANFPGLDSNDIATAQNLLATLAGSIGTVAHQYFMNSPTQADYSDYRETLSFARNFHQNDWAVFFKDNWKVTRNLSLNLGLRYDKYGTPYDSSGLGVRPKGGQAGLFGISGTDFSAMWNPNATGGSPTVLEFAGKHSPNPSTKIYGDDWNNFAPSLGFSWDLPGLGRSTVVRGGYGINYTGAATFLQFSGNLASAPGSSLAISQPPAGYVNIASVAGLFPLSTGGVRPFEPIPFTNRTVGFSAYADNRKIPYVQNFNLSIQRELARNMTLEVSYIGSKGTQLWGTTQLNEMNVFENGILDAFNVTRAGGNAPLFDRILMGRNVTGVGTVNGTTLTGSDALRRFTTTNQWIANGEVAALANWFNSTNALTSVNGGLLRNGNLPENFIVVNPQFGSLGLLGNTDNSIYHSLQTQLRKRLSHGFSGQVSYTWSKNLGNSAGGLANAGDTTANTRDPRNRQLQRGLIPFHRTHQFNSHGTWSLPFGPSRSLLANAPSWVHRVVEGWDLSGIFTWTSGTPLEFETTRRTIGNRANVNTADLVGTLPDNLGKVQVRDGFVEYFETLTTSRAPLPNFGGDASLAGRFTNQVVRDSSGNIVLQNPVPGTTGNTAINLSRLEGPGILGLNMALSKRVRISEGKTFTIRADAINFLNTPQWSNPEMDINSASFGRITTTRADSTRTFTINARIDF